MQPRTRGASALSAVVTLLLSSGCSLFDKKDEAPKPTGAADVTAEGSVHTLENVTIKVAPRTVDAPTKLTVTEPAPKPDEPSLPFGGLSTPNVQFDISLAGGAQPLQPLDVEIPLTGKFLPAGANPEHALLYSPNRAGEWRLVPGIVENGVLKAKVASLSPKHIAFPAPLTIVSGSIPAQVGKNQPKEVPDCAREHNTKAGKIQLGGSGWQTNTKSPVHPCFVEQDGKLKLKIVNNTPLMWTMATDGVSITSQADLDDEMAKFIAKSFNPDQRVKAYLANGDDAWADIDTKSLPATVQLRANPDTYLASALWVGTKMLVAVMTGEEGDELAKRAEQIVSAPGAFDCVTPLFNKEDQEPPGFLEVIEYQFSACAEGVANLLDGFMPDKEIWKDWKGRFFGVGSGIVDAIKLLPGAPAGIAQQFKGDVIITVNAPKPPCATRASFKEALNREGVPIEGVKNVNCSNGWAKANVDVPLSRDYYNGYTLIHFVSNSWKYIRTMHEPIFYGTPENDKLCGELPADFRRALCVRI